MNSLTDIIFSNLKLTYKVKYTFYEKIYKYLEDKYITKKEKINNKEYIFFEDKGKNKKIIDIIEEKETFEKSIKDLEYMRKHRIGIFNIKDEIYPKRLLELQDPPLYLYYIGNPNILYELDNNSKDIKCAKTISIIGSRQNSCYGRCVTTTMVDGLVEKDIYVISGLAKGIDSIAQKRCVQKNGKTIAVIGSGLDQIYPKENINLFEDIISKEGIILSEYPLSTKPLKFNFPWRNRIIAALGDCLLVIEAQQRSGTLITVNYALELGKEILVIPNNIYEKNAIGTNRLIQEGAKIITCIEDVLDEYIY